MKLKPTSIRFRLTVFFVGLLAITLVIFSSVLMQGFVSDQEREFDAALFNYATDIARSIDVTFFGALTIERDVILDREKVFPFLVGQSFLQILNTDGEVVARSRSLGAETLPVTRSDVLVALGAKPVFRSIAAPVLPRGKAGSKPYRMVTYPIEKAGSTNYILQVAVPEALLQEQIKRLLRFFLIAIPLTLAAVALGGTILSNRVLAPVSAMIHKAKLISVQKLSDRLPVPPVKDELHELAAAFNGLLDRYQLAFESQERFVADASHQLKTPLAILRGELDLCRSRSRTPEEMREFVESASQELTYLSRMVDDLLLLARVDAGIDSLEFGRVRLDEVMVEVVSRLERLAHERPCPIRMNLEHGQGEPSDFEITGDSDLIRTLFQSLVENAIKFSDPGKSVEVTLDKDGTAVTVQVRNHGPTITQDVMNKIFERFFRAPSASQGRPGLGLGLAIAKRITETHGGTIQCTSDALAGTTFLVRLPNPESNHIKKV